MKKRFFIIFLSISGLAFGSCNLSKCACNTFGSIEELKPANQQQEIMVSSEQEAVQNQ